MSQKVRKTLIMIVMAALIICLMAASLTYTFTYGRYAGGKFDEESPYDDLIEFVGAREYTVRSPEELIQAIEDGYSNIKIADDAEEPFVITEGVTDVTANLVLNLNGKVVVRNSRNPMLDVQTNVSVVLVYDSKNTGAFYNPVGSSLMASGGSLTVGSGGYESGPRAEEYEGKESAGGKLGEAANATLFARSDEENNAVTGPNNLTGSNNLTRADYVSGYSLVSDVSSLPEIEPKIEKDGEGNVKTVRGNVYLNSDRSDWLPADTFLVYTIEEDCFIGKGETSGGVTFTKDQLYVNAEKETVGDDTIITASEFTTPLCNVASCDFYYYYPIGDDDNDGYKDYAVIYGYWDVMELARDDGGAATALKDRGLIYPYGAVRMVEGEGIVRGGTFSNHFDAVNTYGIYAEGGTLSVSKNTTVDTTFTTGGEGVCIRVQSATGEATTTGETTTTGGSLTISGGEFSSEIGNTIEMSGGNMTVTNGTFKKSGGKGIGEGNQENEQVANQTAMIDMQGGTLNINGSASDSVTMTAGGTDNGGTLTNVFGILAHGGGEVSVGGCTFNINGNYSAGVLSYDGTINLNANTVINVTETHPDDKLTSAGVSSERDTSATSTSTDPHPINMNGKVDITSNGLGITARGMINVQSGITTVKTENATGIVVSGDANETIGEQQAKLTVESDTTLSVESKIKSSLKWVNAPGHEGTGDTNVYNGIYVENGSIDASAGTLNVTHTGVATAEDAAATTSFPTAVQTKSYAVYVTGEVSSKTAVQIGSGTINAAQAGGVYVENGAVSLGASSKNVTINTGGWNTAQDQIVSTQGTYASAVYANGGTVTMKGTITINSAATGIVATAADTGTGTGAVTIESGTTTITAYRSTGVYIRGGSLENSGTLSVKSTITNSTGGTASTAEDAYKWAGADISGDTNSNIYNGVFVNGGSLNSTGALNVTFTGVQNDARNAKGNDQIAYDGENTSFLNQQTKSYAVRVEAGTGTTTVTIASGEIKNSVGGGVLVNGGTVHLGGYVDKNGTAHTSPNPVTVQTTGTEVNTSKIYINGMADNWAYYWNMKGGDAVKVDGGELYVYDGTYAAAQGNGILTRDGTANIYKGTFTGGYNSTHHATTGAASTYSFKAYGGTVNIFGGDFDSGAEGAFVMGTSASDKVTITGGSFRADGPTAFATWNGATVEFDDSNSENKIIVSGESTGLTVEQVSFGWSSQNITVKSATFESTNQNESNKNGIWYGNGNAKLTITGGQFTGSDGSGLFFGAEPSGSNVQLSGGTYYGPKNDVSIETGLFGVIYSISNSINHNAIDGSANISYENLIMDPHVVTGMIEYSNQPSGPDYPPSPSVITGNGIQDHPAAMANGVATRGDVYYSMITISK